jgi:retron-type reverse transcriptase
VRANQGAAGVDRQSIADFEADLSNNLYKLWNRLSSGSYFPPPVRRVDIPKADGGTRPLGIPTVADRIAQDRELKLWMGSIRFGMTSRRDVSVRLSTGCLERPPISADMSPPFKEANARRHRRDRGPCL